MNRDTFSSKIRQLRHAGVHLLLNAQNPSVLPIEILSSSALISFQLIDRRDREVFGNAAGGLSYDQKDFLAQLEVGQCIVYLPQSRWKQAWLGIVPQLEFGESATDVAKASKEHLAKLSWAPLKAEAGPIVKQKDELSDNEKRFLNDVLNPTYEFDGLTERWERSGVKSGSEQSRLRKKLENEGFIKTYDLIKGPGHPIILCEGLQKAFDALKMTNWQKGRGRLPTRAATDLIMSDIHQLSGWYVEKEGQLTNQRGDKKQIDLLCRDKKGMAVAIEVAGNPNHEVHNALFTIAIGETRKHVVVCLSHGILEKVLLKFEKFPELSGNQNVEVMTLAQFLSDKYVP